VSGAKLVQDVIDAADALAGWQPDGFADVFATLAGLPDAFGAVAEAVTVVAITADEARAARPEIITAAEEASAWTSRAAGGLGDCYARYPLLRTAGTRWLPGSAA
jgi:hypothetical protein